MIKYKNKMSTSRQKQNGRSVPSKMKNQQKRTALQKTINKSVNTNTNTKASKSKGNLKQLLCSSHFSHFQSSFMKNNKTGYSMYESKAKSQTQRNEPKSSQKGSRSKEPKKEINSNKKTSDAKNNRQSYQIMKFKEVTTKKMANPEPEKITPIRINEQLYMTPKPAKVQESPKFGIQEQQTQRLESLKKYLHQDTDRITKAMKNSDAHVIEQMTLSQRNLHKCLEQSRSQIKALSINHQREIQSVRKHYETIIESTNQEAQNLKFQLREQRAARVKSDIKLKQTEVMMKCIKEKLQQKQTLCQKLGDSLQNQKRLKLALQQKIENSFRERQSIKKQMEEVLHVLRAEIKEKQEMNTTCQ